jgi:hypothetical protein
MININELFYKPRDGKCRLCSYCYSELKKALEYIKSKYSVKEGSPEVCFSPYEDESLYFIDLNSFEPLALENEYIIIILLKYDPDYHRPSMEY